MIWFSVIGFTDPNIMKKLQVDRGAIKFVLAGANIMCPGLTSLGGALDEDVEAETPVVWILHCFQRLWAIIHVVLGIYVSWCILIISCGSVEILFLQYIFLICRAECSQAIMAEGKEHALAIGFTKMSAKDM